MDKIKVLLEKSGCKPELVAGICNALDKYKTSITEQFSKELANRVDRAKKVCVEETESHKRELARRLQIFCEAKSAAIESSLSRQQGAVETRAMAKLRQVQTVLEGVQPEAKLNGQAKATIQKAQKQIQQLNEERSQAVAKANRQTQIAEKILKQNKALTSQIERLNRVVAESAPAKRAAAPIATRPTPKPVTTRPTLLENQNRTTAIRQAPITRTGGFDVLDIAGTMDSDLI
jgi:hypothetical protein